jgi:hypothetical protein
MNTPKGRIVSIIALVIVAAAAIYLFTQQSNDTQNQQKNEPIEIIGVIGEKQTLSDWEFTVNSIETATTYSLFVPAEGLFVIANITVKNNGENSREFMPTRAAFRGTDVITTIKYDDNKEAFKCVTLGRAATEDIANYTFSKDAAPFTGILVFDVSQEAFDDTGKAFQLSINLANKTIYYDIRP